MRPIVIVFGTRPEAIKTSSVIAELRQLGIQPRVLCTGQHTTLLKGLPEDLEGADLLHLPGEPHPDDWVKKAQRPIRQYLKQFENPVVVVQGDTVTAYGVAQTAFQMRTRPRGPQRRVYPNTLVHLEAGVRSHDVTDPWPEERFRMEIDRLADVHICATEQNKRNLESEWSLTPSPTDTYTTTPSVEHSMFVTGNSGVSSLWRYGKPQIHPHGDGTILVTLHRRELLRDPSFPLIVKQIATQAAQGPFSVIWPIHPSALSVLRDGYERQWQARVKHGKSFLMTDPYSYDRMIQALSKCSGVLTDSGGLTEDATTLGIPTCILRNHHDRPEAVESGNALLVGRSVEGVVGAFRAFRGHWPRLPNPIFGTPESSKHIATILAELTKD